MASRAADWLRQGHRDLDHARRTQAGGDHEWACFAAHQAARRTPRGPSRMLKRSFRTVKVFSLDRAAIRERLEDLVEKRYGPDPNVVAVYLFGSFARGTAVPGSDVDLLVLLRHDTRPVRERIPDYLPGAFPVGVDVLVWTVEELDDRLARQDRMASTILGEGEALLDRR